VADLQSLADALISAEATRSPILPFTRADPFMTIETAYRVQTLHVADRLSRGESLIGTKLGLTSAVKRHALGIHEPVYGRLTTGMAVPFGEPIPLEELIHPRAEPELAFLIGRSIDPPVTLPAITAAVAAVFPAIEVVDSRFSDRFAQADSIADNAGAARVLFGSRARRPSDLEDLHVLGCVFTSDDQVHTATGGAAMGHPVNALLWLANTLAQHGERLEAGTIVLSGGLTASVPLRRGGVVSAEFDGLGTVTARCR
jgi:2-oxo-3-hexenedioate decarboxylase